MEYIYTALSAIGWVFFFFKKRQVDFMTVGFASQQVYFMPCIIQALGISADLYLTPLNYSVALTGSILVVLFIALSAQPAFTPKKEYRKLLDISLHPEISTAIALLSFAISINQIGTILFTSPKQEVLEAINRFYILWTMASLYGISTAIQLKKHKILLINIALILTTVYIGFRSVAAIAAIVILVMALKNSKKTSLILDNPKSTLTAIALASSFFIYKGLYIPIKLGLYELAFERLADPEFYAAAFLNSEPFWIQRILSDVVEHDFYIGPANLTRVIYNFLIFTDQLGLEIKSFNSYFQPVLYAHADYGVGSNVWAHMYSSGGWALLLIFSILYVLSLKLASSALRKTNTSTTPLIVLLTSYWAFYIHRNDLFYQIGLERRIIITFAIVSFISIAINITTKRKAWNVENIIEKNNHTNKASFPINSRK